MDWADRQQVFEAMAALGGAGDFIFQPPGGEPELVKGDRVTASFFDVLRARPMLGAVFTSRDEAAGSDRVVVLSHDFWQRRLGRDPAAAGRTLALNGESYTIVGVMPAGFAYPPGSSQPADLWTLWVLRPQDRVRGGGGARSLGGHQSIARLKADVSIDQAQAQMSQVAATIAAANAHDQHRARHWHSPAARSPRRHVHAVVDADAPGRGGPRPAHRVRERREPVARSRVGATARCGRAGGARRQPRSTGPAAR